MALSKSVYRELLEAFRAGEEVDLIRESVRLVMQDLFEVDAAEQIRADRYERTDTRITHRNRSRAKLISTQAGDVELTIRSCGRVGSSPSSWSVVVGSTRPCLPVVMKAWMNGVSTRAVDDLVAALGIGSGISKSEVSRICAGLDEQVEAFRSQSLRRTMFPYVFLDANYLNVRRNGPGGHASGGQMTSMAVVVAIGVTANSEREILGVDVGDSEDEVFWRGFLRTLKEGGLSGFGWSSPTRALAWLPVWAGNCRKWSINGAGSTLPATCSRWFASPTGHGR